MPPIEIGFYRLGISAPALVIISLCLGGRIGAVSIAAHWRRVTVLAAATALYQVFYYNAVARSGVAVATLVTICLAPPIVAVLSGVILREQIGMRIGLAMAITLCGTGLLIGWPDSAASDRSALWLGIAFAVAAASSYAAMVLVSRTLAPKYDASILVVFGFGGGAILLLPVVFFQGFSIVRSSQAIGLLLYLGLVPTALAYVFFFKGMRRAPSAVASIVSLLEPLVATLLGVLLLHERISAVGGLGAALMIAGLLTVSIWR